VEIKEMNLYIDKLIKGLKNPIKAIYYIIGKGYQKDKVESALINNAPVNLVVHVGGHLAQEVEFYRSLGVEHIIWIEADPSTIDKLQSNIEKYETAAIRKMEHSVINATISSSDGEEVMFNVFNNKGGSSSIKKPTALMKETWPSLSVIGDPLKQITSRLDTVLASIDLSTYKKKNNLLVLDIQGNEGPALQGIGIYGDGLFNMIHTEISKKALYEESTMFEEIDDWMREHGYKLASHSYAYVPWHGDVVYSKIEK